MSTVNYIPANRSNAISLCIILITLTVGINTPDIEKVLGVVGSTIGNVVCILIPAVIFVKLTEKNTTERIGAKVSLVTFIRFDLMRCTEFDLIESVDVNFEMQWFARG